MKFQIKNYFKYFQNKELKKLSYLFSSSIVLVDWENKIKGRDKFLSFLKNIFKKNSFKIILKEISYHQTKKIVFCEIIIILNGEKKIKVIDKITLNNKFKISKIEAYKC